MNRNRDQYKRLTEFIEVFVLLLIFSVIYLIIWKTIYEKITEAPLVRRGNWAMIAAYPILLFVFGKILGLFKVSTRKIDLFFSFFGTEIIVNILDYFIIVLATRVYDAVAPLLVLFAAEIVLTIIWVFVIGAINRTLYPVRHMLLIHGDYSYKDYVFNMNNKSTRYMVQETISSSEETRVLRERIDAYESVLISDIPAERRNDILKYCYDHNKRVYMLPKISDILIRSASDVHVADMQIFLLKNFGLTAEQRFIKRIGDIFISGLTIICTSWLMLIIAILIKAEDHGSVFFRQDRLTRDGKLFSIVKFRSMKENAEEEAGPQLSQKEDSRVTRIGRFLRVTHLDELPQVFNVFMGDMSMVGPRPERPEIMKEYIENVPEFTYRLKVKGGITGYAQVYGRYNTTPYNKLRLDLIYIQNYSFWLDLKCLVGTLKVVFRKETSEGVDESQLNALK